ncbi:MAG: IS982 family transposase [Acidobacteriota bacterium]|nr:IS982 family transposase [Acidobacteriota bacterium]
MQRQLIELYLLVCRLYDTQPVLQQQRLSNFQPEFTDHELVTIYLFGHLHGLFAMRQIYNHIHHQWRAWFPLLPSYQAFNNRLNNLAPSFELLTDALLQQAQAQLSVSDDRLIDSVPVILARASRSTSARVAREVADKTFCASKNLWYHGVKIHLQAARRIAQLPMPERIFLTEASCHDLAAVRQMHLHLGDCALFADKAYACADTKAEFDKRGTALTTPTKKEKNQPLEQADSLWSRFVSAMRQPIESLFNWIIERTGIQNASKVRSTNGLLVHCYGKLAVACVLLVFYP